MRFTSKKVPNKNTHKPRFGLADVIFGYTYFDIICCIFFLVFRPSRPLADIKCADARTGSSGQSQFCEAKVGEIYNYI